MMIKPKYLLPIVSLFTISSIFMIFPYAFADEIPGWVKGVANFWVEGGISDKEFGDAIVFLIESDIIKLDLLEDLKQQVTQLEIEKAYILEQGSLDGLTSDLPVEAEGIVVRILPGASIPGTAEDYRTLIGGVGTLRSFSIDRIIIEPGTTVTWINEDEVSHSIRSGAGGGVNQKWSPGEEFACEPNQLRERTGSYSSLTKYETCSFVLDYRVVSGEIPPGGTYSVTLDEMGFYRLADIDYPWMTITAYVFPNSESIILKNELIREK